MTKMSFNNYLLSLITVMFMTINVHSQQFQQFYPTFYKNGNQQINATAGGIRNGQFSNIDFNNDGIKDLFVFDKGSEKPITFIGVDNGEDFKFVYAPEYEVGFPRMYKYAILHDFNGDGIEDLFSLTTPHVSGINVWRGKRENGIVTFKEMIFRTDGFNSIQHITPNGISTNVYNTLLDIPAIVDVDFDGDTDILTFDDSGTHVYLYKNNAVEKGFGIDTFSMELTDYCFGKFYESAFDQQLFLSNDANVCRTTKLSPQTNGGGQRHSGSSLLALDGDCDNDVDLLLGDLANYGITYAKNGGTKDNAWIVEQDIHFPSYDEPVNFPIFHGMFYVDVNNDGIKDLIISPNESDGGQNTEHIWYYLNKGSNCGPVFELQTKNFLTESLVFVGGRSDPTFIDISGDGLLDMLIGSNGYLLGDNDRFDRLYYYRNTGNASNPEFTFVTDTYLDMEAKSAFAGSLSPCAGDIDSDGDTDLLIGDAQGDMYYFENKNGKGNPINFTSYEFPYKNIFDGTAVKPYLFDIDGDGLNDIITGEQNNGLNYYRNIGSVGAANFKTEPVDKLYGGIFKFNEANAYRFYNSPTFFEIDGGRTMSLIGFNDGSIALYERVKENGVDRLIQVDSVYEDKYFGLKVTCEIIDIDNDGWYDLIVGSQGGGIQFYHTSFKVPTTSTVDHINSINTKVYPNPTINNITIESESNGEIIIFDGLGKVYRKLKVYSYNTIINVEDLPKGIYTLKFVSNENECAIHKIIKI